jgi:hypothetical protein
MKKHIIALPILLPVALAALLVLTSCKKFVAVPLPVNQPATSTIFSDDQTATSAINGLYSSMMIQNLNIMNAGLTLYPALSADELLNTSPDAVTSSFTSNSLGGNNSIVETNFWKKTYNLIYQANAILKGLDNSTGISTAVKNQLTGEAKFVRAFCYFCLLNLFGDLPYVNGTDYEVNALIPRIAVAEVYDKITGDLLEAKTLMTTAYPSEGRVRPNQWVVTALLARVYLYQDKWAAAEAASTEIIDSGNYTLPALNEVFLAESPEAIWQLLPILTYLNTADGFTFIPYAPTVLPPYTITPWLLNAFETNDQRKNAWLQSNTVNGQAWYYPAKYKVRSGNVVTEYNMVFRLAEQYLIRAEARTMQDNISGARQDIDAIRQRAGLEPVTSGTAAGLLTAIAHERQTELFAEWGHRWFDLKRTGQTDAILGQEKPGWETSDALYPVPFAELQANPRLTQNPGY